jgi:hypothetical protein
MRVKTLQNGTALIQSGTVLTPALNPAPRRENFLAQPYRRARSKGKHQKDMARLDFRLERQRFLKEALYDGIDSVGGSTRSQGAKR